MCVLGGRPSKTSRSPGSTVCPDPNARDLASCPAGPRAMPPPHPIARTMADYTSPPCLSCDPRAPSLRPHVPSAGSLTLGLLPAYPGVGDRASQQLQVPDEAAVCLHVGMLDQLGQILLTHSWRKRMGEGGSCGRDSHEGGRLGEGRGDRKWPWDS